MIAAAVLLLLIVCLGLPLFYAWRIWRLDEPSVLNWAIAVADASVFVGLIMLVGRWDIAGYHLRLVVLALIAAAILLSLLRHTGRPWTPPEPKASLRSSLPTILSLTAFGTALIYVVGGLIPPNQTTDLAFPLEGGRFSVAHGGGISLLNHHAGHEAQHFAVDITAIGPAGFRASGILPRELDRYEIFEKPVVSPCDGTVSRVVDGLPDHSPPEADRENPAGNHAVLVCGGLQVELAHFQQGSLEVEPGQDVRVGDDLGLVGNSGNSTEPHLHIHAVDPATNAAVAITFDGRLPVRNRIYD